MNILKKSVFGGMLLAGLMSASFTASADVAQCAAAIHVTAYNTEAAEFYGRNAYKAESSLMGKLSSAELKLSQGKYADVLVKLADYQSTLISMADAVKPKISLTDAYGEDGVADGNGGLDGDVTDAMALCIF